MRRRLIALLVVAAVSGALAGTVANAKDGQARAARIPALPRLAVLTNACPLPPRYRSAFEGAARDTDLPLSLLVSIGQVESNLRSDARSSADARGLLQVLPSTAVSLRLDANRPRSNVLAGARYLELLFDRFQSSDLTLAAYNAGPTAVAKAGGAPTAQTITYVANVTSLWRRLQGCR